ncbi:NAD(P)-dependent oxidoreductase [Conexibacter stalactiti]|uniref:NAD(P)-dependent oxidoreductase n=1 Tax=Conexibacter stalactiti TaxID=1940611 RepID=A0ABU4HMJ0_9ACTN|nr:NAD(P)-dependent oxidoreductase [Conexibacter stalactiti]MDW5594513.1 NAD(P)-dependent oxidoreductase [Conexibacter stalactiti]MEC5035155.1 NAD(P)-dependent oxidoreductase [Conexibacter stalactiti]
MRIAVLGLGRMGAAIAERLLDAGHELTVWNRSPAATEPFAARGVRVAARPADVWQHADAAITMLADGAALEQVVHGDGGLLDGLAAPASGASPTSGGRTVIDMGTVGADTSARIAAVLAERDVALLRAPVSGNPAVVAAGNLSIVVSGPRERFDALAPTLSDIGPNLFYVGDAEQARVVKLALNLMLAGTAQLIAEALVLLEADGVARADALAVIGGSAVGSPFVRYKTDALVADDYSSTFTAELMRKDLELALDAGRRAGVPLPLTAATQQLVQGCISQGMGQLDLMALLPRLRREAGLGDA